MALAARWARSGPGEGWRGAAPHPSATLRICWAQWWFLNQYFKKHQQSMMASPWWASPGRARAAPLTIVPVFAGDKGATNLPIDGNRQSGRILPAVYTGLPGHLGSGRLAGLLFKGLHQLEGAFPDPEAPRGARGTRPPPNTEP